MTRADYPRYGILVYHADHDFIAFGLLVKNYFLTEGLYHGVQSIEKYLKALALSIHDPTQSKTNEEWVKWLKKFSHNLEKLGQFCGEKYPYFIEPKTLETLRRYNEFDQSTRYPWVERKFGNGFGGEEIAIMFEIIKEARNSIPIPIDDTLLSILIRGHHYNFPNNEIINPVIQYQRAVVNDLRKIFPDINKLAKWKI